MVHQRSRGRLVAVATAVMLLAQLLVFVPAVLADDEDIIAAGDPVGPAVETFVWSDNMTPVGFTARPATSIVNSDLAFWGTKAYQGTYQGFRIIDIADPTNPMELINYTGCATPAGSAGSQGDLIVYEHNGRMLLFRSWDAPVSAGNAGTASCGGQLVGQGFEGLSIFDVTDPATPVLLQNLRMASVAGLQPNIVRVLDGAAAGDYQAQGAAFGAAPNATGTTGPMAVVNAGENPAWPAALPTEGCGPLLGFPAGAIAIADRGTCPFVEKAQWAQAAGASALIVANNVAGAPINMGGDDPSIVISAVMVSQADAATIKAGLPANALVRNQPVVTGCGSHTATLAGRSGSDLYIYVGASSTACPGLDVVKVPLADPGTSQFLHRVPAGRACHDIFVMLAGVNRIACAGGNGFSVFSVDPAIDPTLPGGFQFPQQLRSTPVGGVTIGHSATMTYDGKYMVFGHEPGGGSQAQCQVTSTVANRTLFFYDLATGDPAGTYLQERPQTSAENCTWHNFNIVPTTRGYALVAGNYQMGIVAVDLTNPAAATQIAYADPAPLGPTVATSGGDWSSYFYNGYIYESDMRRGLIIWKLDHRLFNDSVMLPYLNPQTYDHFVALDESAPVITINEPQHAATYAVGAPGNYPLGSAQTADFSCADPESGILSCVGTVADGELFDTSTVGLHSFTVTAQNGALIENEVTVTYNVVWDQNTGLLPPINTDGSHSQKAGSVIPIKFSLGADYGLDILSGAVRSRQVDCDTGAPLGPETSNGAAGATGFRYDADADQYIFNWKTERSWSGTCRELIVSFMDNTVHTATIRFF